MRKGILTLCSLLMVFCVLVSCFAHGIRAEGTCEHDYQSYSVVRPTCQTEGTITYKCTKCGDTSKTLTQAKLTHTDFVVARSVWKATHAYHISQFGQDNMTPFKFLNFGDGDSCVVTLYVYNDTNRTLTNINLSYNYGIYAWASEDTVGTRISGSYAELNLPAGQGKTVTLTVPRACYVSNSSSKLTAGSSDSLGVMVSYQDLGLRINCEKVDNTGATGAVYISCLSDSVVTESLAKTSRYNGGAGAQTLRTDAASTSNPAQLVTDLLALYEDTYGEYTCIHEAVPVQNADEVINISDAKTWVSNEVCFISTKEYADPYNDVTMDLVLTNGTVTYTIPSFWDGGSTWRVRFVCPEAGTWTYSTVCSDETDAGLHGRTGTVTCTQYDGDLDIYKHGFVQIEEGNRYFTYADGTPFFYLGDTHWHLGLETQEMVDVICAQRASQGFTVYQSQPRGEGFELRDGISEADMLGFAAYDAKLQTIAAYGLVNACSEFFSTAYMSQFVENHGGWSDTVVGTVENYGEAITVYDLSDEAKAALEKLTRYWVARYGSYPVMWTLAQEADNDFYWHNSGFNGHEEWNYLNNPWKNVAEYIGEYDPYSNPLTAHMENTAYTNASNSAFRDVEEHNWWAVQWSQTYYNQELLWERPVDYWINGQGKPAVLFESKYCYLWTKNFGARLQGWMAFLNGMSGAAWGGHDTWAYTNTYNEDVTHNDGVDIITPAEKQAATWQDALEYSSSYQVGYMRNFFESVVGDWYNLIPRFDDTNYFEPTDDSVFGICASNADLSETVIYFYHFSDPSLGNIPNATVENAAKTGKLNSMQANAVYNYIWFDPVYGQIVSSGTLTADADGVIILPAKAAGDMTLYVALADSTCVHETVVNFAAKEATCQQYGHTAYTYCADCGAITTDDFAVEPIVAHTPGVAATCTTEQICTVCEQTLAEALGHDYVVTSTTRPTCNAGGEILYDCSRCDATKTFTTDKLTHTAFHSSLLFWRVGNSYMMLNYGEDNMTPFKFLDFGDGDTCTIQLYIYNSEFNDAEGIIDSISLSYSWGMWAYADETSALADQRIPGTYLENLNIAPGTGKIVTLTIPKECYISNKPGALTDGGNDSRGQLVSYRDLGLRLDKVDSNGAPASENLLTHVYVACLSDSVVTESIARTKRAINVTNNQIISAPTGRPAQLVADLTALYDNAATCVSAAKCVHCETACGVADPDKHSFVDGICEACGAVE